jgi:hypothetical protein
MIDPKDFVSGNKKEPEPENQLESIRGSFVCQECLETVKDALFNEDAMSLYYTCLQGHKNEATL